MVLVSGEISIKRSLERHQSSLLKCGIIYYIMRGVFGHTYALLTIALAHAAAPNDDDPLAEVRAIEARVHALLAADEQSTAAPETHDSYAAAVAALEDGTHELLHAGDADSTLPPLGEAAASSADRLLELEDMEEDDELGLALSKEIKRRRRAEAALDAALDRAAAAERRLAKLSAAMTPAKKKSSGSRRITTTPIRATRRRKRGVV